MNKTNKRAFALLALIALLSGGFIAGVLAAKGTPIW